MPFDPAEYNKFKQTLKPMNNVDSAPESSGFDPAAYARVKAQVAAPPPAQAPSSRIGGALDFMRRAFMGNSIDPAKRNIIQNAINDAEDIITGTSHLIGQTAVEGTKLTGDVAKTSIPAFKQILGIPGAQEEMARSPLVKRIQDLPTQISEITSPEGRTIAKEEFIKPAVDSFKKSFTQPINSFKTHPLFTFIDWTTALDAVGGLARAGIETGAKVANMAGKVDLAGKLGEMASTSREALPLAPRGEITREFSKNPVIKYGLQKPFDRIAADPALQEFISSNPVLKWIAPESMITPGARSGRVAEDIGRKAQSKFFAERNAKMDEAIRKFENIPQNERESFVAVVQGRALPRYQSPQFKEAYDWYKNSVADEQAKFGLQEETVKRVAYQPLAVAQGLLTPEDYKLAFSGDKTAIAKVKLVTNDLADARIRVQKEAIKEFIGSNIDIDKRTKLFKSTVNDITKELAPDPIYFPSVFENKIKMSDFMPTKFLQRFKPGFLKGRTGVFGFIEKDPAAAYAVHQSQVERYLQNEALITAIKDKFAEPLTKVADLKPGYKPFTPDGYIGFYRGSMPLQDAFLRGVGMGQNIDDAFANAVAKVMPDMVKDRDFIGVRKPKIYQIPEDVAKNLQKAITPPNQYPEAFKLIWDKPLQAFKFSVLAMSPRWVVNNTVGNIVTTMSGRVSPEAFIKAEEPLFKNLIPSEVSSGGFRRAEFPMVKRVVAPSTGITERALGFFSGATPTEGALKNVQNVVSVPFKAIGKLAGGVFEANSKIEDAFRNATFIDRTVKASVERIAKNVSSGIFDMKNTLNKFLERGSFADSNVAKVAGEMLKDESFKDKMVGEVNRILNDYNSLTKFERDTVRRVIPFWSWYKFVSVLFWSMPVKDPVMAQTLKQLGQAGLQISKDEWKANGLDVKEIPEWMRGNVILSRTPDGKLLDMLNTRSLNPFSQATEYPGFGPHMQLFQERRTGRNYLTNAPFTHPNEAEVKGTLYRRENGKTERIDHPTPPPILTHIARQFPQVGMLEALLFPYKQFTGEGMFSNSPRTVRGKEQPINPALKIGGILGMPITETDLRRLKTAHREAVQADLIIRKQMKRSERALERIKLGK